MRAVTALAATVGLLALLPATASAQSTLSLSLEPAVPEEGRPFSMIARGNNDRDFADLARVFSPGDAPCASTAALEVANPDGFVWYDISSEYIRQGPFDRRRVFSGGGGSLPDDAYKDRGLATGRYHACGYLYEDENSPPLAQARLDFTVGGTCASSGDAVTRARTKLRNARVNLRKARRSGSARAIRRARRGVTKAKRGLKRAQADQQALC